MADQHPLYHYAPDGVSFVSSPPARMRFLYAPLCGISADKIKSSVTPTLSGDIKIDKDRFLTKPVSREDLRSVVRNFYILADGKICSLAGVGEDAGAYVHIGQLWHKLVCHFPSTGLTMEAVNFVPVSGEDVELMRVIVRNTGEKDITIIPTAAIPIFGRALANKHDHEHVTALLQRTEQLSHGVLVEPTMIFNEERHRGAETVYFVFGSNQGLPPAGTFPTVESFYGEAADAQQPEALTMKCQPRTLSGEELQGKEAIGALRFEQRTLAPGTQEDYILVAGIASGRSQAEKAFGRFNSVEKFEQALAENQQYWLEKTKSIEFSIGDGEFNSWMHWVMLQPVLRRIFGNSFLPDHDYGKGGKGWRDLWQDLLSLILIEPQNVRESLINNFAGVRIDGTNATIIGTKPGEFLADRNNITRVWMDHGAWPLLTMLLYIHQTGDFDILFEKISYFRDAQLSRTFEKDKTWGEDYGRKLKTRDGKTYAGTVLEHFLIQNLVQFFNVGEHNIVRIESADWNDGLDMAFERGESVTFMSFYGGNLLALAELLETLARNKGVDHIGVALELMILLDSLSEQKCDYNNPAEKKRLLFELYCKSVQPEVSGEQVHVKIMDVVSDLRQKGSWIFEHIRRQEKVSTQDGGRSYSWFNGYYDNQGERVEGHRKEGVRMTLTGQVFPIMSGLANEEETHQIVDSVRRYLKDQRSGGIRLNTDFKVRHYLDFGRAFGFAYGTKENGAFFSHMNVMYAYGLYNRGFVAEGREVLKSIYAMSIDTDRSKIYPGVPEYFDSQGRGMYHYLTGSASWLILTELTQVFGVRGEYGDLLLSPKLTAEEFSENGLAEVSCIFAGKKIKVSYLNPAKRDFPHYVLKEVFLNNQPIANDRPNALSVKIPRALIQQSELPHIRVILG